MHWSRDLQTAPKRNPCAESSFFQFITCRGVFALTQLSMISLPDTYVHQNYCFSHMSRGTVSCHHPISFLSCLRKSVFFSGAIRNGLKVHPDGSHIIYSVGSSLVIEDASTSRQEVLQGHTDFITCIAVANGSGELLASGQTMQMGFKVYWRKLLHEIILGVHRKK